MASDDVSREAGFTLIEILCVLTILALASVTVTMRISRTTDRMSVSAMTAEIASRARGARDLAIRTGRDSMLWVDLDERTISSNAKSVALAIPREVDLEVVSSNAERRAAISGIRFFPNGASTGGTIRLGQTGSLHEVRINWFTGRVQVLPPS